MSRGTAFGKPASVMTGSAHKPDAVRTMGMMLFGDEYNPTIIYWSSLAHRACHWKCVFGFSHHGDGGLSGARMRPWLTFGVL